MIVPNRWWTNSASTAREVAAKQPFRVHRRIFALVAGHVLDLLKMLTHEEYVKHRESTKRTKALTRRALQSLDR
jgi:hypothetical protein